MNQLARRNLNTNQRSYYRGKWYELEKESHGGQMPGSKYHNDNSIRTTNKTAETIAKKQGVGVATVNRDAQFAKAVDLLEEIAPGSEKEILNGEVTKKAVLRKIKYATPKKKKPKPAPTPPARPARSRPTIEPDSRGWALVF